MVSILKKRIGQVFSLALVVTLVIAMAVPAHADVSDAAGYVVGEFWDMMTGKEYDMYFDYWKNFVGYLAGEECPSSPDKYHHGNVPVGGIGVFGSGGTDDNGKFVWHTCDYCGEQFKVYASDLQQSYDAQVAELPATGYQSDGSLLWSPKIEKVYIYYHHTNLGRLYYYCPHYSGVTNTLSCSPTFDCVNNTITILPASGESTFPCEQLFLTYSDVYPINGYYSRVRSLSVADTYTYASGASNTFYGYYSAETDSELCTGGREFSTSSTSIRLGYTGSKTYEVINYYPVVYKVVPSFSSDTPINVYTINSRPTSITGDYGIIGDNGQIIKVEGDKIVNETNNTYINPATGTTDTITDWSYDYSTRTYTLTLGGGTTTTVTYGDENVVIKEGDTTYNVYYLVNGSGSENPAPGPDVPDVCDHTWTETSRTDPTCITAGKVTSTCSKCNQTKTETIPATGHSWVVDRTVQTTYDEEGNLLQQGYTIYSCSVCGEQYKDMEGTGPPGQEEEKSIWEKIGDLIGTIAGGFLGLIEAVLGKLLDALVSLAEMLMGKLKTVVETVLSIFDEVPALFGGFLDFLGAIFPFLPPEITTILTFGVIAIIFIGILKAVRR